MCVCVLLGGQENNTEREMNIDFFFFLKKGKKANEIKRALFSISMYSRQDVVF